MLERCSEFELALELAIQAEQTPESAAERQVLLRMLPRLRRKLGGPPMKRPSPREMLRLDLHLPRSDLELSVEQYVQAHLRRRRTGPLRRKHVDQLVVRPVVLACDFPRAVARRLFPPVPAGRWICSTRISMSAGQICSGRAWQNSTTACASADHP